MAFFNLSSLLMNASKAMVGSKPSGMGVESPAPFQLHASRVELAILWIKLVRKYP